MVPYVTDTKNQCGLKNEIGLFSFPFLVNLGKPVCNLHAFSDDKHHWKRDIWARLSNFVDHTR